MQSFKHVEDSVSAFTAVVVPACIFALSAAVIELLVERRQQGGWAAAIGALLRFLGSCITAACIVVFLTELFKRLGGRLRPGEKLLAEGHVCMTRTRFDND